jgi:hypothetical protein
LNWQKDRFKTLFLLVAAFSDSNGFAPSDRTKKDDHVSSVQPKYKIEDKLVLSASEGSHLSGYCEQDFDFSRTSKLHDSKNELYFQEGLLLDGGDAQWAEYNSL